MAKAKKAYKDFTAEEKAQYKAKRDAWEAKREQAMLDNFVALETAIRTIAPKDKIEGLLALVAKCKAPATSTGSSTKETYLTAVFNTETPAPNTIVTFKEIGTRGPNGERMNKGETMAQFVTRVGDVNFKYDNASINQMVWYLNKRGHEVKIDKVACTVTMIKLATKETEVAEIKPAELIKAGAKKSA